jgi:hypothetical protein
VSAPFYEEVEVVTIRRRCLGVVNDWIIPVIILDKNYENRRQPNGIDERS